MILQALTQYYEDLLALGIIARPGWGQSKVSYGLNLADDGTLLGLLPLKTEQQRGKKSVLAPQVMEVPMPVKRSSEVSANFLCDASGYMLGADDKGKPQRTAECYTACKTLHLTLLSQAQSAAARAVVAFFNRWDPAKASSHPALVDQWEELMKGANLIFWYKNAPLSEEPEVRMLWQTHYDQKSTGSIIRCLVTGEKAPLEKTHPSIKGVQGAQMAGAALVSFNAPSFCSYGHTQGENAPVGTYAAFAYTTALNYLIADRNHVQRIGDTTVVCWAAGGQSAYQDCGMAALYGGDTDDEREILAVLHKLANGEPVYWDGTELQPDTHFYVLGLAPNAARISVRFFWQDSFGALARNVQQHYNDLNIIRPSYDKKEFLSIWSLLNETVNKNSRDSTPTPQMAGDVLLAVLTRGQYPATLRNGVAMRIRAERQITRGRAAILKAYYKRSKNEKCPEEVLQVKLNDQCDYLPYVLGRLFLVLEMVQNDVNPDLNATIRDKYFNSASATPAIVFPRLMNLAQKHLRKMNIAKKVFYNKQITELMAKIGETFPERMSLPEQGAFQIGYYHQMQQHFTKKEEQVND